MSASKIRKVNESAGDENILQVPLSFETRVMNLLRDFDEVCDLACVV